jgi:hypothetical protein
MKGAGSNYLGTRSQQPEGPQTMHLPKRKQQERKGLNKKGLITMAFSC